MMNAFLAISVLISAIPMQGPIAGTPGTIQGKVCEVKTCKPIAGARLVLTIAGSRRTAVTDLAGTFRFSQLPPGNYQLLAVEADNYSLQDILPRLVPVADGANIDAIRIEMRAQGTISGRALDENGEPLTGARIETLTYRTQGRLLMLTPGASSDTDDHGQFRISGLDPDEYYLRITPPIDRVIKNTYPFTYYPNTTDPAGAAKISVTAGDEITGIDLKLPSHGVKVRGNVVQAKNTTDRIFVYLLARSSSVPVLPFVNVNNADQTNDEFELRGVAPGSYYLYAIIGRNNPQTGIEWVRLPLEVGDKDVDDVTIAILPPGNIKGRVSVAADADGPPPDLSNIAFAANTIEVVPATPRVGANINIKKSGEFEIPRFSEMKLFMGRTAAEGWFYSSVRLDGNDVLTTGFSVAAGKDTFLDLVISNAGGTLTGVIKDQHQNPVPAGRIALLPEPSLRTNPFLVKTGVAIERGEFTLEMIPPGEYTAIAFADEDQFTPTFLRDLQSVEKYERFGQHVHIGARETTRIDLTVAPVKP